MELEGANGELGLRQSSRGTDIILTIAATKVERWCGHLTDIAPWGGPPRWSDIAVQSGKGWVPSGGGGLRVSLVTMSLPFGAATTAASRISIV